MELLGHLRILWRRKWVVIVATLGALTVVIAGTVLIPPTYTAVAKLRVAPSTTDRFDYAQLLYSERVIGTYAEIATSRPVLSELGATLGFDVDEAPEIGAEVIAGTELLQIEARDPDPVLARDTANALAALLSDQRVAAGFRVYTVEPAVLPRPPDLFNYALYVVLGLLVGLAGGSGLAFLMHNLDTRPYTSSQIAALLDLPVLGKIPAIRLRQHTGALLDSPILREAFRLLRANVLTQVRKSSLRTLLITSAEPREGKSTIAANLALSFARAHGRVIVVDTDFHLPSLHTIFDVPNNAGLTSLLTDEATLSEATQTTQFDGVYVLTSGPVGPDSAELLGSAQMAALLEHLAEQYSLVLLDTPPFRAVADAALLAPVADGAILVVSCGQVPREVLLATHQQLANIGARLVGLIVNRTGEDIPRRYSKDYYQHTQAASDPNKVPARGDNGA